MFKKIEKLEKPTISLGAWRDDWEFSFQCPPSLHVRLDVQEKEHVQPLSKSAQPSGAVARDSGG